jgi:hypothetical protein
MVEGFPVGLSRVMIWEYVQSGTYVGMFSGQQATLTAGTASGAFVWDSVVSAACTEIPPTDVQIQGGDKIKVTVSFPGGKLQPFDVAGTSISTTGNDLIGGSTTNTANTEVTITSDNPNRTSPKSLGFASQQMYKTTTGLHYYLTRMVPRATISIRPGPMAFRGESQSIMHVSPIVTQRAYNGQVYGTGGLALNLEADSTDYLDYITPNAFHIMAFRQDAVGPTTTFNTTYKPLSTTVTLNATPNPFSIGGTPTALASLTLAGLATLTAAGTTGVYDTLAYETAFVPV